MNQTKSQAQLIDFIKTNDLDKFIELFDTMKFGDTYIKNAQSKGLIESTAKTGKLIETTKNSLDEFGLLTEIVKYQRDHFLEAINKKQLFPITQKDEYTGDNLLHFAVFENKTEFIFKVLHLYENEVNVKNARGNTPFHYACLKGNIKIVLMLFHLKKASKP